MKVRKGDTVKILSGKDRGKTGKVLSVLPKVGKVLVEKVNVVKKHRKQSGDQKDQGGIVEMELPVYTCKVQVICPTCNKPVRVGYEKKNDKKIRICKRCKKALDQKL